MNGLNDWRSVHARQADFFFLTVWPVNFYFVIVFLFWILKNKSFVPGRAAGRIGNIFVWSSVCEETVSNCIYFFQSVSPGWWCAGYLAVWQPWRPDRSSSYLAELYAGLIQRELFFSRFICFFRVVFAVACSFLCDWSFLLQFDSFARVLVDCWVWVDGWRVWLSAGCLMGLPLICLVILMLVFGCPDKIYCLVLWGRYFLFCHFYLLFGRVLIISVFVLCLCLSDRGAVLN